MIKDLGLWSKNWGIWRNWHEVFKTRNVTKTEIKLTLTVARIHKGCVKIIIGNYTLIIHYSVLFVLTLCNNLFCTGIAIDFFTVYPQKMDILFHTDNEYPVSHTWDKLCHKPAWGPAQAFGLKAKEQTDLADYSTVHKHKIILCDQQPKSQLIEKKGGKREFSSYRTWVIIQPSSVAFSKRWNQFLQGKWFVNTLRRSFMCLKCGISVCLRYRQQLEWNASRINLGHLNSTQIEDIFSARNRIMLCAHVLFSFLKSPGD
jgi:hypothetical protein